MSERYSSPRQSESATFDPICRDDGDREAMFPRSRYSRSTAITEARYEYHWLFEDHRRNELEAVASAVRLATEDDYESGMFDFDPARLGLYWLWCSPSDPGAVPAWLVRVKGDL